MKRICVLFCGLLTLSLTGTVRAAEESPAEKTARDWFLATLKGEREKVVKLTRVPFALGDILIPSQQMMQEHVFSAIGRDDTQRKKAVDLTPEAIKVKTLPKYTTSSALRTQTIDQVGAHQFVEVSIGDVKLVIYLTKGIKPKVVGFSK